MPAQAPARTETLLLARLDSPIGTLAAGATGRGLAVVLFGPDATAAGDVLRGEFPVISEQEEISGPSGRMTPSEDAHRTLAACKQQIADYFAGNRRAFDLPLDLRGTAFQVDVLTALLGVPFGQTRSYLDLARMTGRRGGARAVGQVVRRNRIPIVVPCHRIIAADGSLGGYGGRWEESGIYADMKRFLLDHERPIR
jgi:epoxyqueuosine reductase